MNYYVNKDIKNTVRVFPMQGRYDKFRYDMNENPEGLPQEFVDDVLKEITPAFLSVYPEPDRFLQKYADFIGVDFTEVTATNGSDTGLRYILETFGEKGKDVVTVSPSFEMYAVNCRILGYHHVPVSYHADMTVDIEEILDAMTTNTRVVALLNPNNPVGNVYTDEEVERVVKKAEEIGAVVVIDEAYHYYCDKTFLPIVKNHENVILLRTFSKAFAIPALRLGVIVSHPQIIEYIKHAKLTFDVNSVALLFGERLLEHPDILEKMVQEEKEGKSYTLNAFFKAGYECRDCSGNYILVKTKHPAKNVAERLEREYQVLVHAYGNELLHEYLRVSVGSLRAMKIFLKAFFAVDGDEN